MASSRPIVFLGSGAFGVPTLAALAREHHLLAIVTQPDKPAGRGGKLTPTPVAAHASEHLQGVPVLKPEKCNAPEAAAAIRAFAESDPTLAWVVIAYGQYLGKKLLADRFAINLHASLLPRWRGAAPIHAAIIAGDVQTGNSVITIAEKMDAGAVLGQSTRAILPTQTTAELHDQLASDGPALVLDVLARQAAGTLVHHVQDESGVTLASKLSKADARVAWESLPANLCRARINGLSPWPGVTVWLRGEELKLLRAGPGPMGARGTTPGTLCDVAQGLVACGDRGVIQLLEVQPAGKRAMAWSAFAQGRTLALGDALAPAPA